MFKRTITTEGGRYEITQTDNNTYNVKFFIFSSGRYICDYPNGENYNREALEEEFPDVFKFSFEVGKSYYDTFACDSDSISVIKITKRTDKSVWFTYDYKSDDKPRRTKIYTDEHGEYIIPERYYMACVYRAEREYNPEPEPTLEEIEAAQNAEREKVEQQIKEGRAYIDNIAQAHPLTDGAPYVVIDWSEHPAFYSWDDGQLVLSVAAAEIILKHYDEGRHTENVRENKGGYFKTSFTIHYTDGGETHTYEGRYDLGDNDGGLIAHIRAFADSKRKPGVFHDEEAAASIDTLADMLEEYTDGGRVVSVTVPTWFKQYTWKRKKQKEQEQKQQNAEAAQAVNDLMDTVQMLTDEQIEAAVMAIDPNDKKALDIARFFLQELARRDSGNALEVFRRWRAGA